jgi:hypothetical protein
VPGCVDELAHAGIMAEAGVPSHQSSQSSSSESVVDVVSSSKGWSEHVTSAFVYSSSAS